MPLTDTKVKHAKNGRHTDGYGLYLLVRGNCKSWHRDFTLEGKRQSDSFGTYPEVSLSEARLSNAESKKLVKQGISPIEYRKEQKEKQASKLEAKRKQVQLDSNTFDVVATKWLATRRSHWAKATYDKQESLLKKGLSPLFGSIPVAELRRLDISTKLEQVAKDKSADAARRLAKVIKNILEYACNSGYIEYVPMGNMSQVLPAHTPKKMPAITDPKKLGQLLRDLDNHSGGIVICCALKLLPLFGFRSSEFRQAQWNEIHFDTATWHIPAKHRKIREHLKSDTNNTHVVPLPKQAVTILKQLYNYTGEQKHIFSTPSKTGHIGASSINNILYKLGYSGEMCTHGFRSTLKTLLSQKEFSREAIEKQLSHIVGSAVESRYNRNDYLEQRRDMIQTWADYLDALRDGADVIPIRRKA